MPRKYSLHVSLERTYQLTRSHDVKITRQLARNDIIPMGIKSGANHLQSMHNMKLSLCLFALLALAKSQFDDEICERELSDCNEPPFAIFQRVGDQKECEEVMLRNNKSSSFLLSKA